MRSPHLTSLWPHLFTSCAQKWPKYCCIRVCYVADRAMLDTSATLVCTMLLHCLFTQKACLRCATRRHICNRPRQVVVHLQPAHGACSGRMAASSARGVEPRNLSSEGLEGALHTGGTRDFCDRDPVHGRL